MAITRGGRARPIAGSGSARSASSRASAVAAPNVAANAPPVPPAAAVALDPAVMAQLAAVGPALAAIAAAIGAPGVANQNQGPPSLAEPEIEPDDDHGDGDANPDGGGPKRSEKIDLRNIKVAPFDGTVPHRSFDAKAREFWETLDDPISDAQALAGQVWSDEVKKAAMKFYVTGMARRWLMEWLAVNPAASYADAGDVLSDLVCGELSAHESAVG